MIYHLNLNTQDVDILSISETYKICLLISKRIFQFLKEFMETLLIPENYNLRKCQRLINRNVDILNRKPMSNLKRSGEALLIQVHNISCVVLNKGQDLGYINLTSDQSSFQNIGPIALIKIMAAVNHATLTSLNRRLPSTARLRQVNDEIHQGVDLVTNLLCETISLIPNISNYSVNTETTVSTIIIEVEREFVPCICIE